MARQTAQALATGVLVALPTEAGYVLAADPDKLADPARPTGLPDALTVSRLDGSFDPAMPAIQRPMCASIAEGR